MLRVVEYSNTLKTDWDTFLAKSKNGIFFFHRDYMEYHANRFIDCSLMIYDEDKLTALMPASVKDDIVVSHGGLTFGGILTNQKMRASMMVEVFDAVISYLKDRGISKLVYKAIPHIYHSLPSEEDLYALFLKGAKLVRRDVSSAVNLKETILYTKGRKWSVNKAKKVGIEVRRSDDYGLFMSMLENVLKERHDTNPTHSLDEILLLSSRFPENIKLYVACQDEKMLAGTIVFENREVVHTQYMASSVEGRDVGALDFLIDNLIKEVYKDKKYFSFGISTEEDGKILNHGLVKQKEGFGARTIIHDFYEINV